MGKNSSTLDMGNGSAATNYASLMGHNTGFMGMSGGLVDMGLGVMRPRSATVGSMYPGRGLDEYSFRVGLMDRPLPKTYADQIEEMKQQNILRGLEKRKIEMELEKRKMMTMEMEKRKRVWGRKKKKKKKKKKK